MFNTEKDAGQWVPLSTTCFYGYQNACPAIDFYIGKTNQCVLLYDNHDPRYFKSTKHLHNDMVTHSVKGFLHVKTDQLKRFLVITSILDELSCKTKQLLYYVGL
jgi:hypothetical protein